MMKPQSEALSSLISTTDWRIVIGALQSEPPHDVAVLVVSLPTQQGADVLGHLPEIQRTEIVEAIAVLDMMQSSAIEEIFDRIQSKIEQATHGTVLFDEGPSLLAGLLSKMDIRVQEDILKSLGESKPQVLQEVRERLLDFGALVVLDDDSIRLLLDNLELHTLAIALKTAAPNVQERFTGIMSPEEAELLMAEMAELSQEHILASPQIQRVIVDTVRKFQAQGMIRYHREGD